MSEGPRTRRDRVGFAARHRFLLLLLWAEVPALVAFGLSIGVPGLEVALAALALSAFGLAAKTRASQRLSAMIVGLGMVIGGFILVDFAGGTLVAHGYFFLAVGAASLYRDRLVLLVGVVAVVVFHLITSADGAGDPTVSAGLHSAAVIALALLLMAGWRLGGSTEEGRGDESARFRMSFEQAPIGMAVAKPSGELVEVNRAMANVLDYDPGSLIGSNVATLVHPDDQGELGEAWEEMGNSENHSASEWMRCISRGGRPIWSRVSLALVPRAPSAPAMVILQIEAASPAHEEQRRLEMLLQGKDDFVAAVGDEIREPLALLIDLTDAAIHSRANRESAMPRIDAHAREIASIVDNLVVSARAGSRPVSVVAHRLDAEALCRSVLAAIPEGGRVELDFRATDLWADPDLTRQIVDSLLNNAIRYGGPNVELRTVSSGPDTVIQVTDNGPEIPVSERERVFSGDLRNGSPVTRPAAVGLGLTVSRHLARQMDGDIEYRRTGDGENVFELRLPAEQFSETPHRIHA